MVARATEGYRMTRIIPLQRAFKRKIERQENLKGLKFKCYGSCAYVGEDISPGCYPCFYSDACLCGFTLGSNFGLPNVCNRDCVYCFGPHQVQQNYSVPVGWRLTDEWKADVKKYLAKEKNRISTECKMQYYTLTGIAEPLLYFPVLDELMKFCRDMIDPFMGVRGWAKIYTNGTLLTLENIWKLEDLGIDEVRIHLGATNFSQEVYDNLKLAVKHIPTVTVETPAWPPYREKLFEMLPIIQDIGVKHLDICQIEIFSKEQLEKIERALGDVELYQGFFPVMDDGGLVEDLMEEVLVKGYSYSVLDCNGFTAMSKNSITHSYWHYLNQIYPPEWEKHREERKL